MDYGVKSAALADQVGIVVDEHSASVLRGHPSLPLPEFAHERRITAGIERFAKPIRAAVYAVEEIWTETGPGQSDRDIGQPRRPAEGREMMPLVPPAP
ncbi:hypothetical protein [Methylobacterium radiotolerans]